MSYFTTYSTEYDLPHPTLGRHQPRFYIPDRSTYSPGPSSAGLFPGDTLSMHSRHPSVLSAVPSGHSTPYYPRAGSFYGSASRTSLAQLRHVLHSYHAYASGAEQGDHQNVQNPQHQHGQHGQHSHHRQPQHHHSQHPYPQQHHDDPLTPQRQLSRPYRVPTAPGGEHHLGGREVCDAASSDLVGHDWDADMWVRNAGDPMEALIDIHRVLYRGNEDLAVDSPLWSEQGKEVRRVMEQWFEGDCVYDHPLVRLSSRQSLLTHFALLQLFSTAYVPSLTPSSILLHARNITSRIRGALLGSDSDSDALHASTSSTGASGCVDGEAHAGAVSDAKGKRVVDPVDEWLATSGNQRALAHRDNRNDGWWKLWDVTAECRDIGCMECYEGYHIALIDHVVSLSLFPSVIKRLSPPHGHGHHLTPTESTDSLATLDAPPRSFVSSLAASVLHEFDFLLRWDLPVSTIVEFNEVGKATHVRDVVDVQDVINTFVPFAKRFSWLSRRVAGLATSTVGSIALSFIPGHTVVVGDPIRIMSEQQQQQQQQDAGKIKEAGETEQPQPTAQLRQQQQAQQVQQLLGLGSPIGGLDPNAGKTSPLSFGDASNSLGLEGVSSMAPDIDSESQDV